MAPFWGDMLVFGGVILAIISHSPAANSGCFSSDEVKEIYQGILQTSTPKKLSTKDFLPWVFLDDLVKPLNNPHLNMKHTSLHWVSEKDPGGNKVQPSILSFMLVPRIQA